jgi:hypothetical protein
MQELTFAIVKKRVSPLIQFAVALTIGLAGIAICRLLHTQSAEEYLAAFIGIIFFCLISIVVSLANESFLRYTMPCFYLYILLVGVLFLTAKHFSGVSIWKLYEYRNMLISLSLFYFVASCMVRIIRGIYELSKSGF